MLKEETLNLKMKILEFYDRIYHLGWSHYICPKSLLIT